MRRKGRPSLLRTSPVRARLLAGVGALALTLAACSVADAAWAQDAPALRGPISPTASTTAPASTKSADADVYIEADTLVDDQDTKTVTAEGSVEARHQGRILRADRLVYDTNTGAAHATGNVVMINPDGTVEYAKEVELDDQMRAGVAMGFSARLQNNATMAAGAAIRRTETLTELNSAIYTPCEICTEKGDPKTPSWSIQAGKIIQDSEHKIIYYRNAVIRVKGVPVFYAPVFWTPDPSAPRASGFLAPKLQYSNRRGASYEQPYLWVISPYQDLIISPQLNTAVNPLLNLDYRKRFYSGSLRARVGYTYEHNFDNAGKYGDATNRSYILADGLFKLDPKWGWGFGLERVSDPTLFARYNIGNVYVNRGLFTTDTLRLISQVYATRQDRDTYLSTAALGFQSLRVVKVGRALLSNDDNDIFPLAAPLVDSRYDFFQPILGGRLRFRGDAVVLTRNGQAASALEPASPALISVSRVQPGTNYLAFSDSRRASAELNWRATYTLTNGIRLSPFAIGRTDAYSLSDASFLRVSATGVQTRSSAAHSSTLRTSGNIGLDASWPFIRQFGNASVIVEPLAQIVVAPTYKPDANIPNEDALAFEFDDTNLFKVNRFPGYDRYEGGRRFNLGGRVSADWGGGRRGSVMLGRSYRTDNDPNFALGSGLEKRASDWVTAADLTPIAGLTLFTRSRLDSDNLKLKREEAGANFSLPRMQGTVRYLYDARNLSGAKTHSVQMGAVAWVTKRWGLGVNASRDLQRGVWPAAQFSLIYQDDCIRIDLVYSHDGTYDRAIAPSNSVSIRLTLATLGGSGF